MIGVNVARAATLALGIITLYSKCPHTHIRTYFVEREAEIGSYFKGTKTYSFFQGIEVLI